MSTYILRRLLWLGPALFFISLVTFGLMHATPGGPFNPDPHLPETVRQNQIRKYGLDKSLPEQYALFVSHAVQGDLGVSLKVQQNEPVASMLVDRLRSTVILGLIAFAVATVLGLSLGVLSALNRNRLPDYGAVLVSTGGAALPAFVVGIMLIYVFATQLHWLPTRGWDLGDGPIQGWLPPLKQMVLPVVTLALLPLAYLSRITRAALLEVLQQDYMRTARAKGLPHRAVIWRHGMRNAAIPIVSIMGPVAGALITGSFIIENMFGVPGVGTLFVRAVNLRDYNVIMGMTLFYTIVALVLYLLVDIAYAYLDPRVRYR
jgi:ABC-type dipeptide/oligopeptide/nickel transport system permease component